MGTSQPVLAGVDLTNCYTDYGFWPWAVFLPLAALVLYFNRAVARFVARRVTGPARGQRGYESLRRLRDSRGWELVARLQVIWLSGGFLVVGLIALLGLLPCD